MDFFAVDFFAVDFLAVDFFAGEDDEDFFAVDFFAGADFFADEDDEDDEDFLAGDDFFAVDFLAVDFFAGEDDEDFFAVDFFAGDDFFADEDDEDFFAVDFFAGDDFFADEDDEDFFAVDFFAGDDFFADEDEPPVARLAAAAVRCTAGLAAEGVAASTAAIVSFGSFLAPDTTSLSCAPGLKFGTAFFLAFIRCPVEGLRTHRASRTFFSKEPKPVMATFSPLATSRVMVSSTDSSA